MSQRQGRFPKPECRRPERSRSRAGLGRGRKRSTFLVDVGWRPREPLDAPKTKSLAKASKPSSGLTSPFSRHRNGPHGFAPASQTG
jgi:hypothetical protein